MPDTPESSYSATETILAFDFGLRRIGVAVGQTITGSASPLRVVVNSDRGPDFDSITALIDEWRPARLVVGLPLHADGSPGEMQSHVENFVRELWRYQLPIDTVDERYTSLEAEDLLAENIKENRVGKLIELHPLRFRTGDRNKREYHAITRGWIVNEIFRRVDPRGRTVGEYLSEEISRPLEADAIIGVKEAELKDTITRAMIGINRNT